MKETIYLAGGCFWGTEKYIAAIPGVLETQVGYANGNTPETTYQAVCNSSGHAEAVEVVFDPDCISLKNLLEEFYLTIDPTTLGRQGPDIGIQYRTGVYFTEKSQEPIIVASLQELQKEYEKPIVVEVVPLLHFCKAEEYHQKYLDKNPGGYCHINFGAIAKKKASIVPKDKYPLPPKKELTKKLTPLQYAVTQENETEPPFANPYWDNKKTGIYVDITTGEPLFSTTEQFASGCGWPSFTKPIDPNVVSEYDDLSYQMIRTEVRSRQGNAHLGHVFPDGPLDRGRLRYCINSASLRFIPFEDLDKEGYGYLAFLFE